MTEGTKIEQVVDGVEKHEESGVESAALHATKIGELSEFEKELRETDPVINDTSDQAPEQTAHSQKEELERFLNEQSGDIFDYQDGDVIEGVVRSIEKSGVLIDFKFKSDGYVPNAELGVADTGEPEVLEAGASSLFFIDKLETKEGYAILSRRKAQLEEYWDALALSSKQRDIVSVRVLSKVQGGLVASYQSINGFIPASQILRENEDGLEQYIGADMDVVVLQVDRKRRKVIFSNKATKMSSKVDTKKLLEDLEVGQVKEGRVTSIKDFGVFVDLGGIEGLIHISELSWSRVNHPSDHVSVGQELNVFILGVDKENRKISLGMKQLEPDPWVEVAQNYTVGDVVEGTITRTTTFGAFIKLEERLEGLIHISELANQRVERVEDVVKSGDVVHAKIIKLITEDQKIGLSIKKAVEEEQASEGVEESVEDVKKETAETNEPTL